MAYVSQRENMKAPFRGDLLNLPHGARPPVMENYCRDNCIGEPIDTAVSKTSSCISGCPGCSSLQQSLFYRTNFDLDRYTFYNTKVLPRLDTNLLDLSFAR